MDGWIKLYRGLLDKPIWTEAPPEQKVIFVTLLMMANYEERKWEWKGQMYSLKPGQFVTSLPALVQKCGKGVSVQNVRTALKRFAKYGFLTDESTKQNRLITIVNWGFYQRNESVQTDNQQSANRQLTDSQQAAHRQLTPSNKERKKNIKINAHVNEFTLDLTKGEAG